MIETTIATAPADYQATLNGCVFADEGTAGRIFMRGRDRAELLQRLSTNDITRLQPGQGARTVFTTPIGRIIDLVTVHALDDQLLLVTSPNQGGPIYSHLKSNIFFNDQVTLAAAGRSHGQLALFGPSAESLLEQLSAAQLNALPLHHTLNITIADAAVLVARREPIGGHGFTLYIPAEALDAVRAAITNAGARPLSSASLDILRVEQGYAAFGHELSQEYIPLETGLLDAVSFTKGCYVGQEIIARMESRGRLAKRLMGLKFHDVQAIAVAQGKLVVDGKEVGDLTSAVVSPRLGPIALAYVRSAHATPGNIVGIAGSNEQAEVVELPFL